ncbi:MAG: hypothetical protein GY913_28885 [Proteobacteria bacterium]|nr:hypothetical protein [Pseudomonadota bacterium]
MSTSLVSKYKKLVVQHLEIQEEEARAKNRHESIVADRKKIEHDMVELENTLEYGESLMASAPTPTGMTTPNPSDDGRRDDVRKSIRELVLLIPRDGETSRADLKIGLGLNKGALNSRLMDAKKSGYIETAGRGLYKLSAKGKSVHGHGLLVVPGAN